jgi:hypothetical protein
MSDIVESFLCTRVEFKWIYAVLDESKARSKTQEEKE